MQMVANGLGTTLMPRMALPVELRQGMPVSLFAFADPAPSRAIGLAWRRTSPRRADVDALAAALQEVGAALGCPAAADLAR
jgi:LysR family hydrogen peroxide-inducible transcriptional activator